MIRTRRLDASISSSLTLAADRLAIVGCECAFGGAPRA